MGIHTKMVELFHTIVTQTYRIVTCKGLCFEALSAGDTMMPKGGAPNNKQNEWTERYNMHSQFFQCLGMDALLTQSSP